MIIPFFIPHSGCRHQCIFCNQNRIIGQAKSSGQTSIPDTINKYLSTQKKNSPVYVAFYGGSFTALPREDQDAYLKAVQPFIHAGAVQGISLSTRPDCITQSGVRFLQQHHVCTIELGVQSMDDNVLLLAGRGHTAVDTIDSVKILKELNMNIGLQVMLGLPGDSPECFLKTIDLIIALKPDFVRLYPLLVIKDTILEKLYNDGKYQPISLVDAVRMCKTALIRFQQAEINVSRVGIQPTEELEEPGTIVAGPYHPAFRQLVESSIFLDKMRSALQETRENSDTAVFWVESHHVSAAIGQHRSNIVTLKKEFGLRTVHIKQIIRCRNQHETVFRGGGINPKKTNQAHFILKLGKNCSASG